MTATDSVPVAAIVAGDNDRTVFDPDRLAQLADNIGRLGLAQPITVRPVGDGRYQIVAGERRFRAVQSLGWAEIPAHVRDLTDDQASDIMLVENTSRVDLDPLEEARAYRRRLDDGTDVDTVAKVAGVSTQRVRARLELLDLIDAAHHLIRTGQLGLGWARCLAELDGRHQQAALRALTQRDLTYGQWCDLIDTLAEGQATTELFDLDGFVVEEAERIVAESTPRAEDDTETRRALRRLLKAVQSGGYVDQAQAMLEARRALGAA